MAYMFHTFATHLPHMFRWLFKQFSELTETGDKTGSEVELGVDWNAGLGKIEGLGIEGLGMVLGFVGWAGVAHSVVPE